MICFSPLYIETEQGALPVPCGKCLSCRDRYVKDLKVRSLYEFKKTRRALFITLTYNNDNLPWNNKYKYNDIRLFFKRLRIYLKRKGVEKKFKYLIVSENGTRNTERIHYHAILFGIGIIEKNVWLKKAIEDTWNNGFVDVEQVQTSGAISYITKYISKDLEKKQMIKFSNKLGELWNIDKFKLENNIMNFETKNDILVNVAGYLYAIPRYWRKSFKPEVQEMYNNIVKWYVEKDQVFMERLTPEFKDNVNKLVRKRKRLLKLGFKPQRLSVVPIGIDSQVGNQLVLFD
jgi:hypothetical protein